MAADKKSKAVVKSNIRDMNETQRADMLLKALEYRRAGYSLRRSAAELGCSPEHVRNIVAKALEECKVENVDSYRQLTNERLEWMLTRYVTNVAAADTEAGKIWLNTIDKLCKVNGIYAPTKVEDVTPPSEAKEAILERLARFADEALKG